MAEHILVINDTQEILELFRELLEVEAGYRVTLYSYTPQNIREIERIKPDLIILDYIMGTERIGWQTLQKLKMRRSTANIPVIICTAAVREVREIEGDLEAKGVTVVAKPFDIDDLFEAVRRTLETRKNIPTLQERHAEDGEPND